MRWTLARLGRDGFDELDVLRLFDSRGDPLAELGGDDPLVTSFEL